MSASFILATVEPWTFDAWQILVAGASIIAGIGIKALFDAWQKRRAQPVIECELFHFNFAEAVSELVPDAQPLIDDDGKPIDAALISHRMRVRGDKAIRNVQIEVRVGDGNEITHHRFHVEQRVICDRLKTLNEDERKLRYEWTYLNPGEVVEFELVVSPCVDPTQIAIDVDAEGVIVKRALGRLNCPAQYSERLNLVQTALQSASAGKELASMAKFKPSYSPETAQLFEEMNRLGVAQCRTKRNELIERLRSDKMLVRSLEVQKAEFQKIAPPESWDDPIAWLIDTAISNAEK